MCSIINKKIFEKKSVNLIALSLILVLLFGIGLGDRPYSAPSEARYIEIGREMSETGDFVTPRLDYVKYFEKPALFYWIQAEATKYLGLDPFSVRVPTALSAVFLCLLTYALGNMLYGRLAGWISALVMSTNLYMFALSRVVLVDVPVSVFLVATLTAFLYAVNAPDGRKRVLVIYAMYVSAACAVLTKGLIGAVLPGIVVLIWLVLTKKWKVLANIRIISGTCLFLLISVPWHVIVSVKNPEFFHFYFIHEHFERYLTTVHGRYQPAWFFIIVLIAGLFPWTTFAFQASYEGLKGFWKSRESDSRQLFLVIWVAFIFVFFSLSDSKLIPYILPVFPPIAALLGKYLADVWEEKPVRFFGHGLFLMMLLLVATSVVPTVLGEILDSGNKVMLAIAQAGDDVRNFSIIAMILAGTLLVTYIQGRNKHLVAVMIISAAVIVQAGDKIASHYNKDSMQKISELIKQLDKPGDEIVLYDEYYQDLPVYLKRKVTVACWQKTELDFGAVQEKTSEWMIDDHEFWRRWLKDDHLMFAVMLEETYKHLISTKKPEDLHLYGVIQNGRNILFMNHLPEKPKEAPQK